MSSIWQGAQAQAARFGSWSDLPPQGEFQPLYGLDESGFAPRIHVGGAKVFEENSEPPVSIEALTADAFAEGFEEGTRVGRTEQDADRAGHLRLSLALEQLQAESSGALSALLSTAVLRLVRQIAGEVEIDADLLAKRCLTIAECIEQEVGQPALRLHPDDVALMEAKNLPVRLVPDAEMLRGSVRLETADGWVEDGPEIRLSRLQGLLDDMTGQA